MQSFPIARAPTSNTATGHEVNDEQRELATCIHNLDRDNFDPAELRASEVAVDAWGGVAVGYRETTRQTIVTQSTTVANIRYAIPREADTEPWVVEMTTGDGMLAIDFSVTFECVTPAIIDSPPVAVGVVVDGVIAAWSPATTSGALIMTRDLECAVPVGAGTHRIEFVYTVYGTTGIVSWAFDWKGGTYFLREVSR